MAQQPAELFGTVRFEAGFPARVARALARCARRRAAWEGAGRSWIAGGGADVAGLRAYRPGDDPRAIDWSATARSERAIVRVLRRAAGGLERIVLDASLSMAIGPPGKLQRAAELAAACAAHALRAGAAAQVHVLPHAVVTSVERPAGLLALLAVLEGIEARGRIPAPLPRLARAERTTWIGDLAALDPASLMRVAPRGTALHVVQLLAPVELDPRADGPVTLWEPETGARLALDLDAAAIARHRRELDLLANARRNALARRGARFTVASSAEPFEEILRRVLRA